MPTDRTKMKAKYHPTVRADGTPLACREAAADVNGTPAFERLFLAAPACVCTVFADKGYDAENHRTLCRTSHAALCIHKRGQPHASGPGEYRWPVERTLSWLLENKRPGLRYDRCGFVIRPLSQKGCIFLVAVKRAGGF